MRAKYENPTKQNSSKPDRKHKGEYWGSEMVFPGNNGPQDMPGMDPQGIILRTVFEIIVF